MSIHATRLLPLLTLLALARTADAKEHAWKFTTIDAPGAAGDTEVFGVTSCGLATGNYLDANGARHGLLWKAGKLTVVDHPKAGAFGTLLFTANVWGQVAGGYYDNNGIGHASIYDSARKTWADLPDIANASVNLVGAIDVFGRSSGNYTLDPNQSIDYVAWIHEQGRYQEFVDPSSVQDQLGTITYGMNDFLSIAGYYSDNNGVLHGFVRDHKGRFTTVDIPGADDTTALGITNGGVITGRYGKGGARHGYILEGRKVTTIDVPNATNTWVYAITGDGETIAGTYTDAQGNAFGFVATREE